MLISSLCGIQCRKVEIHILYYSSKTNTFLSDAVNAMILYLLHGIIIPTNKKGHDKNLRTGRGKTSKEVPAENNTEPEAVSNNKAPKIKGRKGAPKFGVQDSIQSMIKTRTTISAMCPKKKLEQPHILAVGEDIFHLNEFFCVIEETKYKATSLLHALEITFKAINLFNFGYASESVHVWTFIQKYFFDIHYPDDSTNGNIPSLIEKLKIYYEDDNDEEEEEEEEDI